VYLAKLPGIAQKVRVAIQWTLDLLFSREAEQFVTLRDIEQIERLAALVRSTRSDADLPMNPSVATAARTSQSAPS
jgi:hypothetical protein